MHPDVNYIGIEKFQEVSVRALHKKQARQVDNLALL
jgi:tRNA G46 methylase TrmB